MSFTEMFPVFNAEKRAAWKKEGAEKERKRQAAVRAKGQHIIDTYPHTPRNNSTKSAGSVTSQRS
jgi:hypothetical protein